MSFLKMAKKRKITARFPSGEEVTRTTDRIYTHVVGSSWVGRPDLVAKRMKQYGHTFTQKDVAVVIHDPWNFQKPE